MSDSAAFFADQIAKEMFSDFSIDKTPKRNQSETQAMQSDPFEQPEKVASGGIWVEDEEETEDK